MLHELRDAVSLALARRIAAGLESHPEWLELARSNLARWSELNTDAPRLLACYQEWLAILNRPIREITAILLAESDEGQRLRQTSPFVGVLSATEVWEIKRRAHETTAA